MRAGRASFTASFVATMRSLAGYERTPLVEDAWARSLVDGPFRVGLSVAERLPRTTSLAMRAASVVSRGKIRHLELRTRAIDDVVSAEAAAGAKQLVILGAGLDVRAHRLPALAGVTVFEVDHPDTQRAKRERLAALDPPSVERVRWVAVDFERDRLGDELDRAGFDRTARTTFLWEGVTMYLTEPAVMATIEAVAALAAPGSALALTYRAPGLRWEGVLADVAVRVVGEPFRLVFEPSELAQRLGGAGFEVTSDESSVEWGKRYLGGAVPSVGERLAVAHRALPR